ncbi:hypothetical protein Pyrde_0323 [Pyrodictium delaneyi]|uniref:Uncharacterized protein n=1 Tax=Pyrodictium delaneyi TaxID=1273541 RepID=A0A0P0N1G6_9CREN|nr:hypothetical protein Pyrde_0323 [Pyrodictium delaneyi]
MARIRRVEAATIRIYPALAARLGAWACRFSHLHTGVLWSLGLSGPYCIV